MRTADLGHSAVPEAQGGNSSDRANDDVMRVGQARDELEQEAWRDIGVVMRALMTPGRAFPNQRQLRRAWRALQLLEGRISKGAN